MIDGSGSDVGCWIVTIEASYMLSSSSARVSNDKIGIQLEYIKRVCAYYYDILRKNHLSKVSFTQSSVGSPILTHHFFSKCIRTILNTVLKEQHLIRFISVSLEQPEGRIFLHTWIQHSQSQPKGLGTSEYMT